MIYYASVRTDFARCAIVVVTLAMRRRAGAVHLIAYVAQVCARTYQSQNVVAMAAPAHSWETPDRRWSWEGPDEDDAEPTPWHPDNTTADETGEHLYAYLTELKMEGRLSARQACILAYSAGRAGAHGAVSKLGQRPGLQTGKYSAWFDRVVGKLDDTSFLNLRVPGHRRSDDTRAVFDTPVLPPHQLLATGWAMKRDTVSSLIDASAARASYAHTKIGATYTDAD